MKNFIFLFSDRASVETENEEEQLTVFLVLFVQYYSHQKKIGNLLTFLLIATAYYHILAQSDEPRNSTPDFTVCTNVNAQKMKFSIKDFLSKCGFGHIY